MIGFQRSELCVRAVCWGGDRGIGLRGGVTQVRAMAGGASVRI